MSKMKPLLVGEANPYGDRPGMALYPYPERSAGWNLCVRVLGMERAAYLRTFDRANLCGEAWSITTARVRAAALLGERLDAAVDGVPVIVLLGKKVCDAFRQDFRAFSHYRVHDGVSARHVRLVVWPHPSGLSRLWSSVGSYERARGVLREAGVSWDVTKG